MIADVRRLVVATLLWLAPLAVPQARGAEASSERPEAGELRVTIRDAARDEPIPCTVTLIDANGQTVTESEGFRAGFRSTGVFAKRLPPGRTRLRVTRGPEYKALERQVELRPGEICELRVGLERQVDLRRRGWYAGDSHVHMAHGERAVPVDFDQVALAAKAEDLQYLSLGQAWELGDPTPERLEAELGRRSTEQCVLTWGLEAPKNYYLGDAGRCLGHCWTLGLQGRTPAGDNVIGLLLEVSAADYESWKPPFANFESHALVHAQGGTVFYTHPARWWMGPWGGKGGYERREMTRVSNLAVELPLDLLAGPTFDGLDVITGSGELTANEEAFQLWALLLNQGYRLAATASSDACFDRSDGATPGAARLYTFFEGEFSVAAAAAAAARGRTFVTTGPILLVSVDGQPPGSAFPLRGAHHEMGIEVWPSGASGAGLKRVEILRDGRPFQVHSIDDRLGLFRTSLTIPADRSSWYCVRAFGSDERRERAISGAFFFDEQPWVPPAPQNAVVKIHVLAADTGRALDATLTEMTCVGAHAKPGTRHRLRDGSGTLTLPATARLQAEVSGFEPVTLSLFFDYPPLLDFITRLEPEELLDWHTYERIRELLGEVDLTFRMKRETTPVLRRTVD